jgi:hypothetical protein
MPDRHTTSMTDGWLSCTTSVNPNPARSISHWVMIDLGDTYALQNSTIWNFNTPARVNSYMQESWSLSPLPGALADGIKDMVIDLSTDGVNWVEWGRYSLPIANGSSTYEGSLGPNFEGKIARKILVTAINNHGGTCYGMGEIRIKGSISTTTSAADPLAEASITAQPNPFSSSTQILLDDFPTKEVVMTLRDMTGRLISQSTVTTVDGQATYTVSGLALSNGLYILTAAANGGTKTVKLEVIK